MYLAFCSSLNALSTVPFFSLIIVWMVVLYTFQLSAFDNRYKSNPFATRLIPLSLLIEFGIIEKSFVRDDLITYVFMATIKKPLTVQRPTRLPVKGKVNNLFDSGNIISANVVIIYNSANYIVWFVQIYQTQTQKQAFWINNQYF